MSTTPSIPEWGSIYTVKFQPKVSLGLELWRVTHRIPPSMHTSLPSAATTTKSGSSEETMFDIATVHNVLPGGTADLHLGANIQQGDLLISLNGDSLVGYFRHEENLKLESLLHIVADCPIQRTLWFFRPTGRTMGQEGDVRFPLDCAYLTPLMMTRWNPPPNLVQLRDAKEKLKPTDPVATLVSAASESKREKTPDIQGYVGPKGGIPHASDRRPETAPENIRILFGKIVKKGLFLPEGEGILLFAEKKLRAILYDIRVNLETEVQRMKDDEEALDGDIIKETETVSEEGHVVVQRLRTRRVLTFHCRELYHGTPLYGTDVYAQKSEIEIMEMVQTNAAWSRKIAEATKHMAGTKQPIKGTVNKTIRELLLKMMDLGNTPGDRRKFLLNIRVPRPVRKSLRKKVSSKAMLTTGVNAEASIESLGSLGSFNSPNVSPENSIVSVMPFDSISDLGITTVAEEEQVPEQVPEQENNYDGDGGTIPTPISSVTKFNILESLHDSSSTSTHQTSGRPASALITSEPGSRGSSRPSTAPAREGKERENKSKTDDEREQQSEQKEATEDEGAKEKAATQQPEQAKKQEQEQKSNGPSTDDKSSTLRKQTKQESSKNDDNDNMERTKQEESEKKNSLPSVKSSRSKSRSRKNVTSVGTAMTPETTLTSSLNSNSMATSSNTTASMGMGMGRSPVASNSVPNIGAMSALSALQMDESSLRLQKVDTLRTQQNVTLMQIVEIEKRLEEQRLEMLRTAMPGDVRKLLRAFRHEREAAARNIRKVVAKQRADLRSAMVRYSVEFLGRSSHMRPVATGSMHLGSTSSARGAGTENEEGEHLTMGMSGAERDVLYDMGSAGNMMGNVTGYQPTLSSMGSAILSTTPDIQGGGGNGGGNGGGGDDYDEISLPPLHR
jgi:hypothetical protein